MLSSVSSRKPRNACRPVATTEDTQNASDTRCAKWSAASRAVAGQPVDQERHADEQAAAIGIGQAEEDRRHHQVFFGDLVARRGSGC